LSAERTTNYRLSQVVSARVERVFPFGAFVRLDDGTQAYVRQRELTQAGDLDPRQVVSKGDTIEARVVRLASPKELMELSVRQAEPDPWDAFLRQCRSGDTVRGTVKAVRAGGLQIQIWPGVDAHVSRRDLVPWRIDHPGDLFWAGDQVEAVITQLSADKWIRLSIRRHMMRSRSEERRRRDVDARLRDMGIITEYEPGDQPDPPDTEEPPASRLVDLGILGPILVLDHHPEIERELISWLQLHGGRPDGVTTPREGLDQAERTLYRLALVDPDLAQRDGLEFLRDFRAAHEDCPVLVMSTPAWIAEQCEQLEALRITHVFAKPLDFDEVLEILARLAEGGTVGPFRVTEPGADDAVADSFQRLAGRMRSGAPVKTRLRAALAELLRLTSAESGALFHLDPVSRQVRVLAQAGSRELDPNALPGLSASPVKDLIVEGRDEFETSLSSDVKQRRFKNLLDAIAFESCIGVPVSVAGRVEHALFAFSTWPDAFNRGNLRDARVVATLMSVALESQALEAQLAAAGPYLLSGQLASAFSHDVSNKMDLLDLQVRNLKGRCRELATATEKEVPAATPPSPELMEKLEQLLENTIDLKSTAHAFGELLRADQRQQVNVNEALKQASRLLGLATHRERIRIWLDLAPDLPPVVGHPVRLRQVFVNVMLNAIQQMTLKLEQWPDGLGQLTIATSVEPKAGQPVQVRFSDSGPGIHHRLWEQIFALGYSTRPGGSGLGLFIARSLLESEGGTICVEESLVPLGTVFRIELPVAGSLANTRPEVPDD
jgi:signal transduction histidine kinase/DNA-binding response OmpR family regulator/predicted RNA-binding protein with RPS1 domain